MRADKDAQHLLLAHPESVNGNVQDWLQRRRSDPDGYFAVVTPACGVSAVGFVQLVGIHRLDRYAFAGIALLDSARGQGFGRAAMLELMRIARDERGLRKLLLYVRSDNLPALQLYHAIGYRTVGVMREQYDDGARLHDVMLLEILLATAAQ
ncbi:hypothetical protein BHK69_07830 [Bosea vaviloviae]|uniref:N-acetyltransferase domain-containing protein n=1 Tax=Bosea vaviloviae TaxID=1526658 RepID=A0A1D7UA64_9HYPH|nr:hypothetical protein BHK69_07830 [Bosea vaviloviae]